MTTTRQKVLGELADRILALRWDHPTRVGIDGHSAAGKTTLADELATILRGKTPRPVLRVSIDHFKRHVDLRTRYPAEQADIVIDNRDFDAPRILRDCGE